MRRLGIAGLKKNGNIIAQRLEGIPHQQAGRICDQLISAAEISGAAGNFSRLSQPAAFTQQTAKGCAKGDEP